MGWLALIFIGFIIAFTLLLKLALTLMGKVAGKQIGAKHRAAEQIVNKGKVPRDWMNGLEKKISSAKNPPQMEERAKEELLKKLDALIEHFKGSPLAKDKETRRILLHKLQEARESWEKRTWDEITVQ